MAPAKQGACVGRGRDAVGLRQETTVRVHVVVEMQQPCMSMSMSRADGSDRDTTGGARAEIHSGAKVEERCSRGAGSRVSGAWWAGGQVGLESEALNGTERHSATMVV